MTIWNTWGQMYFEIKYSEYRKCRHGENFPSSLLGSSAGLKIKLKTD